MYNKNYSNIGEEKLRYNIYLDNRDKIAKHNVLFNKNEVSFELKMNQYTDMLHMEFVSVLNGFNRNRDKGSLVAKLTQKAFPELDESVTFIEAANVKLPPAVDWRDKGAVTPIKDQGQCGSCWSFSSTGALEGQNFLKTGKLVSLSEQNLVDCSRNFGNMGCDGGLMDNSYKYIKYNNGIDTESSYPYEAVDDNCRFNKNNIGATDNGYVDLGSRDENALMNAVATIGPISVGIDASKPSFQFYDSGIYYEPMCSSTALDHAVLVGEYNLRSFLFATNRFFLLSWIRQ